MQWIWQEDLCRLQQSRGHNYSCSNIKVDRYCKCGKWQSTVQAGFQGNMRCDVLVVKAQRPDSRNHTHQSRHTRASPRVTPQRLRNMKIVSWNVNGLRAVLNRRFGSLRSLLTYLKAGIHDTAGIPSLQASTSMGVNGTCRMQT